jgi:hypothetical protein
VVDFLEDLDFAHNPVDVGLLPNSRLLEYFNSNEVPFLRVFSEFDRPESAFPQVVQNVVLACAHVGIRSLRLGRIEIGLGETRLLLVSESRADHALVVRIVALRDIVLLGHACLRRFRPNLNPLSGQIARLLRAYSYEGRLLEGILLRIGDFNVAAGVVLVLLLDQVIFGESYHFAPN